MRELLPPVREHEALGVPVGRLLGRDGRLDLYPEVTGRNYLRAHLAGDTVQLSAGNHVGLIPLNDRLAVVVNPRVNIHQMSRLLRITGYDPIPLDRGTRLYAEDEERLESIVDHLTMRFISLVDEVLHRGLIQHYQSRSQITSFPRGRMLAGQTVQQIGRGQRHLVAASWFEPTWDVLENRLLKFVLVMLGEQYLSQQRRRGHMAIMTELNRLVRGFDAVTLESSEDRLLTARFPQEFPAPWAHYSAAVSLACLLIRSRGIDLGTSGQIGLPSLLINMENVFEGYLRKVLSGGLAGRLPGAVVLDGNVSAPEGARQSLFSDREVPEVTPDIVVRNETGTAVLEVKYKTSWSRNDLNQSITYGMSYGAKEVVILHLGTTSPVEVGSIGTVRVHSLPFNLSAELEREEERMCDYVAGLF